MKINYKIFLPALLTLLLQNIPVFLNAQITFEKVYPIAANTYSIMQSGRDVIPTSDGGYLLVGMTTTTIAGDSDIYLIKTDYLGDTLWTKTYGGSKPDYVYSFIPTNDGNYFVLGFTMSYGAGGYDTWLLKLDPNGVIIWTKTYGTTADEVGHQIIPTADGKYMITGQSNNDAFLMKIDPSGNVSWTQTYGGTQDETSHSVAQCLDGGYIITGQTFSFGQGAGDIYVVKTDMNGNALWTKTFGGVYADEGSYVLANSDGTFIIDAEISSNSTEAGYDIYVVKLDASGNVIWNHTYGGNDKDVTHMIQPTNDNGYIIAGISRSFGWINPQMWLVKIDVAGDTMWTRNYGSWYHDHCYAVRQTSDGGYVALGHQEDNSSAGITHVFFLKLNAQGEVPVEEYAALNNTLSVYPNPSNGIVKIDFGNSHIETGSILKIYNSLGQVLFSEIIDTSVSNKKIVNLKDKEPGIYFVSVQSEKNIATKKIILK